MKGMVFTGFLEMVEKKFGLDTVDAIIENADLPSGGAYTAVGTYPHSEMVNLLVYLEKEVSIPIPQLLTAYGNYLFGKLAGAYPKMLENYQSSRELLKNLDGVIHVEVAKLYPDAELPKFKTVDLPDGRMEMHYLSDRHLEDLAEGLLMGCLKHYKENAKIDRSEKDGFTIFTISNHQD